MYTKEEIWSSFANEIRIIKHLAEKIEVDKIHHKPSEKSRSTLELLQYMSRMGKGMFRAVLEGSPEGFTRYADAALDVTSENFVARMDEQEKEMRELFSQFTDEELRKELTLWGRTQTKSLFLLDILKMVTGYKMQLFLYIKQSTNPHISTMNLWAGMDAPAAKQ